MRNINLLALILCLGLAGKTTAENYNIAQTQTPTTQKQAQQTQVQIPIESMYRMLAAEMAIDRADHETAVQNYIAAARETQDAEIAERATQIALTVSTLETAVEPALIWATTAPKNLEANLTVAAIFIRLQSHHKAAHYLSKVEKLNPEQAYYHFLLVYRQLQGTNGEDVINALNYLVEATPSTGALLALSEIDLALQKFDKADALAQKVLDTEPNNTVAIRIKSESLRNTKGNETAAKFLQEHVNKNPDNKDLALYHIEFLSNTQQFDQARMALETLLKSTLSPEQSLTIARTAMEAQWYDLAEKSLKNTLSSKDHQNTAHYMLARIAELQAKEREAIKWYSEVLAGPFHVISQIKASQLLTDIREYDKAIDILRNTQPQNEFDNKRIVLSLIDVYNRKKEYGRAVEVLDKVLKLQPEDTDYLYTRAINNEKLNKFAQAQKDLELILVQDPYHVEALNALGYMMTIHTQKYDEALSYLNRAVELAPNNASVLDSIGWLHYKMGNLEESVAYLRKAAEIMPDAEIAAHLGEVLWQMNNRAEAKKVWQSAIKDNPDHEMLTEVMKRLEQE